MSVRGAGFLTCLFALLVGACDGAGDDAAPRDAGSDAEPKDDVTSPSDGASGEGGWDGAVTTLVVRPDPASVATSATQLFTVTPAAAVTWSVRQVAAPSPSPYVYPLKVSATGRYLVDQMGRPWRVQADAGWFMSANATPADVDTYLTTRKAQGFNSFYLMAMVHEGGYAAAPGAPNNKAGVAPFTTPDDFLTPNEPYWQWIDAIVDKAAAQGMVVMLAYDYLGYAGGSQGWAAVVGAMTKGAATTWGSWLGDRYKSKGNILWFSCGDYTPPAGSPLEANVIATIQAIKAAGATQPFMTEMNSPSSVPTIESPAIGAYLDMNSYYGYGTGSGNLYVEADRAYSVVPPKPAWVQESGYEYENNTGGFPPDTSYATRRTRFWNTLAGGTAGDGFGSRDAYAFQGFPASLSTPGATYAQHAFELFATTSWWDFLPSGTGAGFAGKTLVTAGAGTWGDTDFVTSAVTSDGKLLFAYAPGQSGGTSPSTFTVDMTAMAGSARARWWNPTTGASTAIADFPNTGTQSFTTPGTNGSGNDWLLILDATGTGGACGSIDAAGLYTAPATIPPNVTCQVVATLTSDPAVTAHATVDLH
jgi:hypothetical protein